MAKSSDPAPPIGPAADGTQAQTINRVAKRTARIVTVAHLLPKGAAGATSGPFDVGSSSVTFYGRAGSATRGSRASPLLLVAMGLVAGLYSTVRAQTIANEYRLKAAFVYQFPQFVEWPAAAWQSAPDVQICILQPNPFGRELDALVRGESLNGRPFSVREVTGPDGLGSCHVLFIGGNAPAGGDVLKAARGSSVLTIGEGERFLDQGGIIALHIVERRVRFEVSAAAAQKVGLRISSQLLRLALNVRGGPP